MHVKHKDPVFYAAILCLHLVSGGISLKQQPSKTPYDRKRTRFIRIVAIICAVLLFGSVLLSAVFT